MFSCKSRKLQIKEEVKVDKSEIKQESSVTKQAESIKTDNTVIKTSTDASTGEKTTEEYEFTPAGEDSLKTSENSLPMNRLKKYKKTVEKVGNVKEEKEEIRDIDESLIQKMDSVGSSDIKNDISSRSREKSLDAVKNDPTWIWAMLLIIVAIGFFLLKFKSK